MSTTSGSSDDSTQQPNSRAPKFAWLRFAQTPVQRQVVFFWFVSVLGMLNHLGWVADLFSHFYLHYAVVGLLLLVWFVIQRHNEPNYPRWIAACVVLVLTNAALAYPALKNVYTPPQSNVAASHYENIKLFHANVFVYNYNYKKMLNDLAQMDADVISLQEVRMDWSSEIWNSGLEKKYPYQFYDPIAGNYLLSRMPMPKARVLEISKDNNPGTKRYSEDTIIDVTLRTPEGQLVRMLNFHPSVPVFQFEPITSLYLQTANELAQEETGPLIVWGDFNTTANSTYYQALLSDTKLQDARRGFGLKPSWPSFFPPAWIAIDHVFTSPHFEVRSYETGKANGSDHLPVRVELALPSCKPTLTPEKSDPSLESEMTNASF